MVNIPQLDNRIQIVTENRTPTLPFHQWWQKLASELETAITELADAVSQIQAALNASAIASLTNSGVTGLTLSATDAGSDVTVTASAHTRIYGDGTRVNVEGGTVTGLSYSTEYYIYYEDAERDGTGLTYLASTDINDAAQVGDTHLVGSITTPAASDPDTGGYPVLPPGSGSIEVP